MLQLTKALLLVAVATAAATNFDDLVNKVSEADFDAAVQESKNTEKTDRSPTSKCFPDCPFGWAKFDGRCYAYRAVTTDWASAESHCLNLGANLVSIHNENEYQLVKALIRSYDPKENPTWIGLSNCQKKNSWVWSDGTKVTYTKWNPKEPNFKNKECCAHMNYSNSKDWNDIPCGEKYNFVCVRRINPYNYMG